MGELLQFPRPAAVRPLVIGARVVIDTRLGELRGHLTGVYGKWPPAQQRVSVELEEGTVIFVPREVVRLDDDGPRAAW